MSSPGSGPQHARPGTDEGADDYQKAGDKLAHSDYQARMEHFHHKNASKPMASFGGRPHGGPLRDSGR
jgi:hypothetical protein